MTLLRSLLFQIYIALATLILGIAFLPALAGPRRWIAAGARLWAQTVLFGLRIICGQRVEILGAEHIPASGGLLAGKHQSMWETVVILTVLKDPAVVLKRELLFVPVFGWYTARLDMIVIRREERARALKQMVLAAKRLVGEGRAVVIFPEGTRRKPGAPPDYKPGIAALYNQLGTPVVPFAVNSGHFWQGALRKPGVLKMQFLPAIPAGLKRDALMAGLETQIETAAKALAPE
jgi:1-acyl-sn-glycerol-3-phosphate acyltransferase